MEKYAVSACLCGKNCRYDGGNKLDETIAAFAREQGALLICPECMVMKPPHPPSENTEDGRTVSKDGRDLTELFREGARRTLELCQKHGVTRAILKEKSPSCGVHKVYDGTFTGTLREGRGIAAALLEENGIEIISEDDFLEGRIF